MYENDENRIIIKDKNFLVYIKNESFLQTVIDEVKNCEEYNGEKIVVSAFDTNNDFLITDKIEKIEKEYFYR